MISRATLRIAADLAQSLADSNMLLVPTGEGNTPVSIMADHYHVGAPGLKRHLSYEAIRKLRDDFGRYNNGEGNTVSSEERDHLVELLVKGQTRDLYNIRQVLLPIIKEVHKEVDERSAHGNVPDIEVKMVEFSEYLSTPSLVGHLETYRRKATLATEYNTIPVFTDMPSDTTLIEMMTAQDYRSKEDAMAWALSVDKDAIRGMIDQMFIGVRHFPLGEIATLRRHNLLAKSDAVLALYFITGHLRDNPENVAGYSLEEWEKILGDLHDMLGLKLLELLELRQQYIKQKRLIIHSTVVGEERLEAIGVYVQVNSDVAPAWMENGGDVRALLGAAILGGTRVTLNDIDVDKESLIKRWDTKHHLIKLASLDSKHKRTRSFLRNVVKDVLETHRGSFDDKRYEEVRERVDTVVNALPETDLQAGWTMVCSVVCRVLYPNSMYETFLKTMDARGKNLNAREAALLAHIETLALWYRSQVKVMAYTPDIAEAPTTQETD